MQGGRYIKIFYFEPRFDEGNANYIKPEFYTIVHSFQDTFTLYLHI